MYRYHCLNPIARTGIDNFDEHYEATETMDEADAVLVRSAGMQLEMEFGKKLKAIARAGAGVNNIPLERCAENGIVGLPDSGSKCQRSKRVGDRRNAACGAGHHWRDQLGTGA